MLKIRAWRAGQRKQLVDSIDVLLSQPQRMTVSRYTSSAQRAKWTRLAGQLLWYKDQILRAMTWEALQQDVKDELRDQAEDRKKLQNLPIPRTHSVVEPVSPAPSQPTIVKKKKDEEEEETQDSLYSMILQNSRWPDSLLQTTVRLA